MQFEQYNIEFKEKLTMKDRSDICRVRNKRKTDGNDDNGLSYMFDMFVILCAAINGSVKTDSEKLEFIQSITDFTLFNAIVDEIDKLEKRESERAEEKKKTLNITSENDWAQGQ